MLNIDFAKLYELNIFYLLFLFRFISFHKIDIEISKLYVLINKQTKKKIKYRH